jgi:perosamine synthetase
MSVSRPKIAIDSYIPLSVPSIQGNEWAYTKDCLDTGWVSSSGQYVDRFEKKIAELHERKYAVAIASGTAALHLGLVVAGVKPGEDVVVSTLTFIASANAIHHAGCHPVFMDVEPRHAQIDTDKLADFLENGCELRNGELVNLQTGRRVSAIMPVHILGHACDIGAVETLAAKYGLKLVVDATEAAGTLYRNRPALSFGDIACLSFNGNKILTSGGGGMILTDDPQLAQRARYLSTQAKDDDQLYIHGDVGYNYRLSNVSAAIGLAQAEQLAKFVNEKRRSAALYDELLKDIPGIKPIAEPQYGRSSFWLYTVLVDPAAYGATNLDLMRHLETQRIQTRPLWQPIHRSLPYKKEFAWKISVAEKLHAEALSLPSSIGLSDADRERVAVAIRGFRK